RVRTLAAETNRARGGRAAGEQLSDAADRLIGLLRVYAAGRAGIPVETPGIALLALGSYGRRELAPYSDIDLLILHQPGTESGNLETFVGNLLRPLWDAGLQMGHSVHSPQECLLTMDDAGDSGLET